MTPLIEKLDKHLLCPQPVEHVKLTKHEWAELRPLIEDGLRYRWLRDAGADERNRLDHYAGPALEEAIDQARKREANNAS